MQFTHQQYKEISNTIRGLSIDAINKANSGHPGLPLGCADLVSVLYLSYLNHHPKQSDWINRDRFILSAGHGSMLLYSILHLCGYNISLNDIKQFRTLNSITAGHPEYHLDSGIETTTGPLGQGFAQAVGMALSQKRAQAEFNTNDHKPFSGKTYVLAGDGCLMEGISAEASSLAGHLKLNNLVVIYDSNDICLDGPTSETFTDNTAKRYDSYNWHVIQINGHDYDEISKAYEEANLSDKPTLIIAKTTIGYGSPNRAGTSEAHGKALGNEEGSLTKKALGISESPLFYVSESCEDIQKNHLQKCQVNYTNWLSEFKAWTEKNPEKNKQYQQYLSGLVSDDLKVNIKTLALKDALASRSSSQEIIQHVSKNLPNIIGGSADLSCSDSTYIKNGAFITSNDYLAPNIKYGVREFAMSAIAAGISLGQIYRPFIGTFFTFSDYMKNGIRLSAIMNLPIIYQFTHDSILLGEDGPTHQPIEHLASLRSIPNLTVIRPADNNEVKGAWIHALNSKNPVALILSRQNLPNCKGSGIDSVEKGAYTVKEALNPLKIDICILATGSELALALEVAEELENNKQSVRVISVPSFELFDRQNKAYQDELLHKDIQNFVVIEAQTSFGWHKYVGRDAIFITVETFGLSAPADDLKQHFGFTKEAILNKISTHK